ncbi:uncharacterized protein M421DRAFT_425350 [Didymella exigua CBS 183.55]|uniref:Uncharacterized protein n=1 Tax=Didymella exigua CBS 183.55 TaxID=1150837 RepID=A0A6A5R6Q2_9PLEO|nr:uncharacterized protein M421DRAFT_425350 [Didymella exigua CBS 183.55]KAF1923851.1 hypothetical protein M421DRAFT_425350 [Didymella exigua CBS 183.55]
MDIPLLIIEDHPAYNFRRVLGFFQTCTSLLVFFVQLLELMVRIFITISCTTADCVEKVSGEEGLEAQCTPSGPCE